MLVKRPQQLEFLVVTVSKKPFVLESFTDPPSIFCSFFFNYLETLIIHSFSNLYCQVILTLTAVTLLTLYTHCMLSNLIQTSLVTDTTHVNTNGTATLIDLALVSTPSLLQNCEVIPPIGNSDHNGILLKLKWNSNMQQV